jgi:hypothetical protein
MFDWLTLLRDWECCYRYHKEETVPQHFAIRGRGIAREVKTNQHVR